MVHARLAPTRAAHPGAIQSRRAHPGRSISQREIASAAPAKKSNTDQSMPSQIDSGCGRSIPCACDRSRVRIDPDHFGLFTRGELTGLWDELAVFLAPG